MRLYYLHHRRLTEVTAGQRFLSLRLTCPHSNSWRFPRVYWATSGECGILLHGIKVLESNLKLLSHLGPPLHCRAWQQQEPRTLTLSAEVSRWRWYRADKAKPGLIWFISAIPKVPLSTAAAVSLLALQPLCHSPDPCRLLFMEGKWHPPLSRSLRETKNILRNLFFFTIWGLSEEKV